MYDLIRFELGYRDSFLRYHLPDVFLLCKYYLYDYGFVVLLAVHWWLEIPFAWRRETEPEYLVELGILAV